MHKDRLKIATALGYYARASMNKPATPFSTIEAFERFGLPDYRGDIDCQIAFRKGIQEAEDHIAARGPEAAAELRALCAEIKGLLADLKRFRGDAEVREHAPRYSFDGRRQLSDAEKARLFNIQINQRKEWKPPR